AKVALNGLARNKMRVVPGIPPKVMSAVNQYLPRVITAPIVGRVYKQLGGG
ncbi:MAG TPA: short-chain dehydrogenase, partial [Mycobacterium sp.]|nr:short-chain dehydrogenase [Mycobacterium sp.]